LRVHLETHQNMRWVGVFCMRFAARHLVKQTFKLHNLSQFDSSTFPDMHVQFAVTLVDQKTLSAST
jgi:hypothetical protein